MIIFENFSDISNEVWKDIRGYERYYEISSFGRVRSKVRERLSYKGGLWLSKPKVLRHFAKQNKYLCVTLTVDKTKKHFYIHRLVAQAFIPNPNNKPEVNHLDNDVTNNTVPNLEWCTPKGYIAHAVKSNCFASVPRGEDHFRSKLTETKVLQIRNEYRDGVMSQGQLAQKYEMHPSTISQVITRKIWNHI